MKISLNKEQKKFAYVIGGIALFGIMIQYVNKWRMSSIKDKVHDGK